MIYDICIIGGGASGLTAAIAAGRAGASVLIAERLPQIGKKILATGNGRCNLSNRLIRRKNLEKLTENGSYRLDQPEFAVRVLSKFDADDTVAFFESLGVMVHDKGDLIYPLSDQAGTVSDAFKWALAGMKNVDIKTDAVVLACSREKASDGSYFFKIVMDKFICCSRQLILAAGSPAGYKAKETNNSCQIAKSFGHHIHEPLPALCALKSDDPLFARCAGVRLNALVRLQVGKTIAAQDQGEVQITSYGISGIPVFQVSRFASLALAGRQKVTAHLDMLPDVTEEALMEMILKLSHFQPGYHIRMILSGILNQKLAAALIIKAGIDSQQAPAKLKEKELKKLVRMIKDYTAVITGTNTFEQAQSSAGGVSIDEIDPDSLSSRMVPGLYIVGELLDVDGICGGYNLQWAWATGYIAGNSAGRRLV